MVVTYVVDGVLSMHPAAFFPDIPGDFWSTRPELCTPSGDLLMSAGGLLVERDGTTLLIDAGVGTMQRDFTIGTVDCGAMIDVLDTLAHGPGVIDTVAFTHLHFDHAGWAFVNGAKTFPSARYVMAALEWEPYANGASSRRRHHTVACHLAVGHLTTSSWSTTATRSCPVYTRLSLRAHTPGHTSYVITSSQGRRLVVLGDAFHSPVQLARPEWMSVADTDLLGGRARAEPAASPNWPSRTPWGSASISVTSRSAGSSRGAGDAIWEPAPTAILAPPPR